MGAVGWFSRSEGPRQMADAHALREFLTGAPGVLLLLDEHGEFAFRSAGALRGLQHIAVDYGDGIVQAMRTRIRELGATARGQDVEERMLVPTPKGTVSMLVQMRRLAHGFAVTYTDLSAQQRAGETVTALAHDLRSSSGDLAQLGTHLADGADRASELTQAVAGGAAQMSSSIAEIANGAGEAARQVRSVAESTQQATETMHRLREASEEIGSVVRMISAIADQTKLLALNATIEASRAGESGRGFLVVADEVKGLAGRTAEATGQVTDMISTVQDQTTQAADAIGHIEELIDAVVQHQAAIASAVDQQAATATEISLAIERIAATLQSTTSDATAVRTAAGTVDTHAGNLAQAVST
ncbi:MAG TPA: methyl-accepting chemotaxis protein [Kineosporiaceae bacterium]|nr:methyl-accepting chemotaxis protein [Kineosporiaceae bacterium]